MHKHDTRSRTPTMHVHRRHRGPARTRTAIVPVSSRRSDGAGRELDSTDIFVAVQVGDVEFTGEPSTRSRLIARRPG
ncbi:MAG: hypothetical protein ACRDTX_08515 [Pseudonocardiaceae bacterium]